MIIDLLVLLVFLFIAGRAKQKQEAKQTRKAKENKQTAKLAKAEANEEIVYSPLSWFKVKRAETKPKSSGDQERQKAEDPVQIPTHPEKDQLQLAKNWEHEAKVTKQGAFLPEQPTQAYPAETPSIDQSIRVKQASLKKREQRQTLTDDRPFRRDEFYDELMNQEFIEEPQVERRRKAQGARRPSLQLEPRSLRQAVIMKEILDKPLSYRD
ncbi:hypothetical protein [Hutsoniella sourekii]|uniref:hypothetical protein n=1 Tax=Hutsoniella sourekii TaxID=87650 RepID=UPI000487F47D|nr:hypothetical protein [Hutsoniella sourekii]